MSVSLDPGSVCIGLKWQEGAVREVAVRVARPTASAMLRGRVADEAVRVLPMLYAICGVAQGVAAGLALAAARGVPKEAGADAAVLAEAQREHLWRLLLDWPLALGMQRQEKLFVVAREKLHEDCFAAWARESLRGHCDEVLCRLGELASPASFDDPQLPAMDAGSTVNAWPRLDAGFAREPLHCGAPASTGALARHPELASLAPLEARVMARAADLVAPHGLGWTSSACVAPGIGRAAVETARGLLLHEIVLDGDRVADYTIVAPTEWNFHPAGALKRVLAAMPAADADALKSAAQRAVLAFDPCVRAEIDDAGSA